MGLVLTSSPKLGSGYVVFLACLTAMSPAKEKIQLQKQFCEFKTFESQQGLFFSNTEEMRKQPKSCPRSGGVQWAELYRQAEGSMDPL